MVGGVTSGRYNSLIVIGVIAVVAYFLVKKCGNLGSSS